MKTIQPTAAKVVRIDPDVYRLMQEGAVEFGMQFSSPSKILRVMLGIDPPPNEEV